MATLREIRGRIVSVRNITKITSAMKMVSAAKMRRATDAITAARPYAEKLESMLKLLSSTTEDLVSPLFEKRDEIRTILLIVVAADRGLCGSFNSNVIRITQNHVAALQKQHPKAKIKLLLVGRRVTDFFIKRSLEVVDSFPGVFQKLEFATAQQVARIAVDGFVAEEFDKVQIIGNIFKSIVKQEVCISDFLPILPEENSKKSNRQSVDYIYEPSQEEVLSALLPKHLNMQIWKTLLDSNAAEQAARMMAMDNATTNAKKVLNELQLTYNKARQAAITTEILEIVGGAEALKKG